MIKKILIFSTLLVAIFGIFLRLQTAFTNTFAFTYDVGRDMLALQNLVYHHKVSLIGFTTGLPGVFYGPWWYFILSPSFFISQGDPQAVAFFVAILGIVAVGIGFLAGKKIGGTSFGLLFLGFLSMSPALISLSVQIWNPNIIPLFMMLLIFTFANLYKKQKLTIIDGIIIGVLSTFIFEFEIVFGILFFVSTFITILLMKRSFFSLKSIFGWIVGFIIIISPRLLFDLRHNFLMTKSLLQLTSPEKGSESFHFLTNLTQRFTFIADLWTWTEAQHNFIISVGILVFAVIVIMVCKRNVKGIIGFFLVYCVIACITYLVGLTLFRHQVFSHYIVGLPVFFALFLSLIFSLVWESGTIGKWITITGFVGLFFLNIQPIQAILQMTKPQFVGDASLYRNQLQVLDYVYKIAAKRQFKTNVYTPPVHDYTYQYLFDWYGKKIYGYSPAQKSKLAFFILEPDLENPQRLIDWLMVRKDDGKIISEKKFSSGIKVQVRD